MSETDITFTYRLSNIRTIIYITVSLDNRWHKLLCILRDNNSIIVSEKWGPLIHSIIVWRGKRMAFTDCRFVLRLRTMQLTWCLNLSFGRITVETYCGKRTRSAINTRWLLKYSDGDSTLQRSIAVWIYRAGMFPDEISFLSHIGHFSSCAARAC